MYVYCILGTVMTYPLQLYSSVFSNESIVFIVKLVILEGCKKMTQNIIVLPPPT